LASPLTTPPPSPLRPRRALTRASTSLALIGLTLCAALCVTLCLRASADEGMWTLNGFPKEAVQSRYGFTPDDAWLLHVQRSAARLASGCSASFVSPQGLVMTNHHCVQSCLSDLSTASDDLITNGFYATAVSDERACPGFEVNRLQEIIDVTARVQAATASLSDQAYSDALKAVTSTIEAECATSDALRCDVVSLYRGGLYHLYKYERFQDVRLAFAPEVAAAAFGGDPDNFNFPRYALDAAFLRVYQDAKPLAVEHFLSWSKAGAADGELTFTVGNPGRTDRLMTVAELAYQRDVALPERIFKLAEYRGFIHEFQHRGEEQRRVSSEDLFFVENAIKALKGRHQALTDAAFFAQKQAAEAELRAKIAADPVLQAKYGGAFAVIDGALVKQRALRVPIAYISGSAGFDTELFGYARTLLRAADELSKPNAERLPEFADARLASMRARLLRAAPVNGELEVAELALSLTQLREDLGADHPFVKAVLGPRSPLDVAKSLVEGSTLSDPAERARLLDGGAAAVAASADPMIALARAIDPEARAMRKRFEEEIEAPLKKSSEQLAQARFALYGTSAYPDATFSMRVSFGAVQGFAHNGAQVAPFTKIAGAFARHTGADPFSLPPRWLKAQASLDQTLTMNLVTNNDIIGGNSGSPMINQRAEVVGLVFDGNIYSLGGAYGFDPTTNRTVAVSGPAIIHALEKVYGATRLTSELTIR
jgi:hypothetical protein